VSANSRKGGSLNEKKEKSPSIDLSSRFWRTLLTMLAALLIFAGPTYTVLVLWRALDLDYALSIASGFLLFVIGLALLLFSIRRKIIS